MRGHKRKMSRAGRRKMFETIIALVVMVICAVCWHTSFTELFAVQSMEGKARNLGETVLELLGVRL